MLVLSRKRDESIVIGDPPNQSEVMIMEIRGDKVRLGIKAPKEIPVHRWKCTKQSKGNGKPMQTVGDACRELDVFMQSPGMARLKRRIAEVREADDRILYGRLSNRWHELCETFSSIGHMIAIAESRGESDQVQRLEAERDEWVKSLESEPLPT